MPLFEFGCAACGRRFEQLLSHRNLTAEILCPSCGSDDVSKLFSTFATNARTSDSSSDSTPTAHLPTLPSDHCGLDWRSGSKSAPKSNES